MSIKSKRWRKSSASPHTTTVSPSPASDGVKSTSASSTPVKSSSSGSRSNRSLRRKSISPIGYGEHDDPRARLLGLAGYQEETLAQLVQRSIQKKVALLEASKTVFAHHEGQITDEREVADRRVQLEASKALDDILGIKAPPARQAVTVVHKIELPEWMCPDEDQPTSEDQPKIVNVTGEVEE